jgi:DNA polymerase delta subunit 2
VHAMQALDALVAQLTRLVPVDVLPGAADVASAMWPQQPIDTRLLPSASTRLTNPARLTVAGADVLLSAGQNVTDLARYCTGAPDELAERALHWRLLAPTAPDTLPTFPYHDTDPFVLQRTPHLYVIGNQPAFATRVAVGAQAQRARIVCVPAFTDASRVVLVDMHTPELVAIEHAV